MINLLFFDSDCISAFLWVNEQNLLTLLYPGKVVLLIFLEAPCPNCITI